MFRWSTRSGGLEVQSQDNLRESILRDAFGLDFHSSGVRGVGVGLWTEGGETDNV